MSTLFRATTVSALVLTTMFVGCARRPSLLSSATAPSGPAAAAPAPAKGDAAVAVVVEEREIIAERQAPATFVENANVKPIYFDFDKAVIRPGDAKILDASATWLKSNGTQLLLIEGHADERGTNEYNLALGDRRAKAAMNYLVAQGISADRMTIVSYGEERPVCTEHTEACWAKNRRDQFMVKER